MTQPTCMFCVGATKAGTSWLHRYLSEHPQCHMRGIKELHYFDALEFDDFDPWINDVTNRYKENVQSLGSADPQYRPTKALVARDAAQWLDVLRRRKANDAAYLAYLQHGLTDQRLVADITPAYGLLSRKTLAHMAAILPDVRFVYLLRDPVDRFWSNVRMLAKRRALTEHEINHRSVNIVRRAMAGQEPEIVRRSDYITPVQNLMAEVAPANLHFIFFEDLFTAAAIDGVCRFLGLDPEPADFGKHVMKGPKADMDDGQYEQVRKFLAPQYDFVGQTFDRVPARWRLGEERVA